DVACGKAGPALILAQEFGCSIHGVDVSTVFIETARRRIAEAGLEKLISVEITDAAKVSEWPSCDAALCIGAAFVGGISATLLSRSRRLWAEAVRLQLANRSGERRIATRTDSSTCRRRWCASRRPAST